MLPLRRQNREEASMTDDLADTLAAIPADRFPSYTPEIYGAIVAFLAQPGWQSGTDGYSPEQAEKLRKLPIYNTIAGRCVSLAENVFVPSDFRAPEFIQPLTLLSCGESGAWRPFFLFLKVPALERYTFIEKHLLPSYASLPRLRQLEAMQWLRDHLEQAETEMEQDGLDPETIRAGVTTSNLVLCENGTLKPANRVYHPECHSARELLGDAADFPDMSVYSHGRDRWIAFFRGLGMAEIPRAQDIFDHIQRMVETAENLVTADVAPPLMNVFLYLNTHWAELREEVINDDGELSLAEVLADKAWLPAVRDARRLAEWPGAGQFEDRLYSPNELYLPDVANLVASKAPIFDMPRENAQLCRDLGFPEKPHASLVLEHFDRLLEIWSYNAVKPTRRLFAAALDAVYSYFAQEANTHTPSWLQEQLRTRYAETPCLWHQGVLWKPAYAFRSSVPFFGQRRTRIPVKGHTLRAYELLGMRMEPAVGDFLDYLCEIHDVYGDERLPDTEVMLLIDFYAALGRALVREREEDGGCAPFVLLSRDGRLVHADDVWKGDAPWFVDRLSSGSVALLHDAYPRTLHVYPGSALLPGRSSKNRAALAERGRHTHARTSHSTANDPSVSGVSPRPRPSYRRPARIISPACCRLVEFGIRHCRA